MELYKYRKSVIHVILWAVVFSLAYLVFNVRFDPTGAVIIAGFTVFVQVGAFYLNYHILAPNYYLKQQYLIYFFTVVLVLVGAIWLGELMSKEFIPNLRPDFNGPPFKGFKGKGPFNPARLPILRSVPLVVITTTSLLISSLLRITEHARLKEREAETLRAETYNAELKFLRSQINPHFLFNALNNIYSLAVTASEKTPDMLLKLSNILRYLIYECNVERVPLLKEIEYINNFIDLQKLKDENIKNISCDYKIAHAEIAPMILITFVENSFKHSGIENLESNWININLSCGSDGILYFEASNSIPKTSQQKDKTGGIGLENAKKRLSLLYPDKHELNFNQNNERFEVRLKIDLN